MANLGTPSNNLLNLAERICVSPSTFLTGIGRIVSIHWPQLFGTSPQTLVHFGINSHEPPGMRGAGIILAVRHGTRRRADRHPPPEGAALGSPVPISARTSRWPASSRRSVTSWAAAGQSALMRYDLLSILGAVGLSAWFLRAERSRTVAALWLVLIGTWSLVAAVPHGRLLAEYLRHPPVGPKILIARELQARGIRYGTADYWDAYYITFVTRERILLASSDSVRIPSYNADRHRARERGGAGLTTPVRRRTVAHGRGLPLSAVDFLTAQLAGGPAQGP